MNLYFICCGIVFVICAIGTIINIIAYIARPKIGGTLHIDSSRDDKFVCLFTLELPIETIQKKKKIVVKIDANSNLKEWEE